MSLKDRSLGLRTVLVISVAITVLCGNLTAVSHRAPSGLEFPSSVSIIDAGDSIWTLNLDGSTSIGSGVPGYLSHSAWFDGDRPPRNEMVVVELEYVDDYEIPAVAEVLAGMDTQNGGWFELHRFGGTKSGGWEKIRIPAPADLTWQHLDDRTIRFRLRSSSGPLTIRNPKLTHPRSGDEESWNAETREWVRREQHDRVSINPIYWASRQTPVLEGETANQPMVVFKRDYMYLVDPRSAPQAGETRFPAEIRMFLNEYQPLQLGVYANGQRLRNVRVAVDPVEGVPFDFTVRTAEYSIVKNQKAGYFLDYFPQRLWPAYPFDVPRGLSHLVLVDFQTIEGKAVTGKYETAVHFSAEGLDKVSVPVVIKVLPIRLLTMEEAGLRMGGCVTGLLPEYEMEALDDYNHNMINIWYAGVRPEIIKRSGDFDLDFRVMDDFMMRANRQGFHDIVYFLGGNPPLFPRTMHWPRSIAKELHGIDGEKWRELAFEDPHSVPPMLVEEMVEWARRLGEHAVSNSWPNVILTPFDEPAKWVQYYSHSGMLPHIKDQFIEQVKLLRRGWPEVEIYGSIHHYYGGIDFLEYVDIFCTNAIEENPRLGEEVRMSGSEFWQYSGTSDKGLPGRARYTFGHYFASHDSRGSLAWAYNWGNRFDTIDGSNWMYVWNTPFDLVPAPYMIGMREAWDDRRLRETVRKIARDKDVDLMAFWGRLHNEIAHERGLGGSNTVDDFWETARDNRAMERWKTEMIEKVIWLQEQ